MRAFGKQLVLLRLRWADRNLATNLQIVHLLGSCWDLAGAVLAEFLEVVRIRLGAAGPTDPTPCARCGVSLLDSAGSHAVCCGISEATRGHYAVSKLVLQAAQQCDPGAEAEVAGLIPGTALRPADVGIAR